MFRKNHNQNVLQEIFAELNGPASPNGMPRRIKLCRQALTMLSREMQPELWGMLQDDLASSLVEMPTGPRAQNLEQAIHHFKQALEVRTRQDHQKEWASTQNNLANAYCDRIIGERAENIEKAIDHYQQALEVRTREADPERWAMTQFNLAGAYYKRIYEERAENLELAIQHCKQALEVFTHANHLQQWAQAKNTLGEIYRVRISESRMENLEESIRYYQQALEVHTRSEFPEYWAMIQNNLAAAYSDRIRGERAENMERAIRHSKQALEVRTRESDPERWAMTQFNLGNFYRFRIRGELEENIEQAIHYFEQALNVHTLREFPAEWARTRNHLGSAYLGRMRGDRANNLELAIQFSNEVLEVYAPGAFPEEWAQTQNNLGNAYIGRIRGNRAKNVEMSILCYKQALTVRTREAFPKDWAETQNNLAIAYTFRLSGKRAENIDHAIYHWQQALEVYTRQAFPDQCLKTARAVASLAFEEQRWELARNAYDTAFRAQELLMQASLSRAGKQTELGEVQSLPPRAAYANVQLGELERAVEVLEQGRAQLLRESLERQRQDLKQLPELGFEHLYKDYMKAMEQHDALQKIGVFESARSAEWVAQMELALEKVQAATAAIREEAGESYPQYRYFLQALQFAEIQKQARDRSLVYLCATTAGGFALLVSPQGVVILELPELNEASLDDRIWQSTEKEIDMINTHVQKRMITREDIQTVGGGYFSIYALWSLTRYLTNTSEALKQELSTAWQKNLDDTTRWLWEVVMGELVPALKEHSESAILIPAGHLAVLPLHAAWTEDTSRPTKRRYALDEINITYAPSAHALWQANLAVEGPTESLMAVDNPDGTLPWARDEVRAVLNLFEKATHLPGEKATCNAVKENMQTAHVLHFATHGQAGWQEEELARLKLVDGDLTLPEVFELRLRKTRLAVLSACETGVPGLKLIDEMIGLPAGLMQAGVPGVVGSLWAVDDGSTALLMQNFYTFWRKGGMDPREALRQAQIWLRDSLLESPYHWAAFTYTGV